MKSLDRFFFGFLVGVVAGAALLTLGGCGAPVAKDRPVRVAVPVPQPCARARPAPVVPLKDQAIDWSSLDVKQKAAWVARQGLDHKTYGEQLGAATAACP